MHPDGGRGSSGSSGEDPLLGGSLHEGAPGAQPHPLGLAKFYLDSVQTLQTLKKERNVGNVNIQEQPYCCG